MDSQVDSQNSKLTYRFIENTLYIEDNLTLNQINLIGDKILHQLEKYAQEYLTIDLSNITYLDSAGVAYINYLLKVLDQRNVKVNITNIPQKIQKIFDIFKLTDYPDLQKRNKVNIFEIIGEQVYYFITVTVRNYFFLMTDLLYWSFTDIFYRKNHRKGEIINQSVLIGVNAVYLIGLIAFLIGFVLALQSAAQLRQFGANIFIVDLIVIAMTREMGPLLTAIMIAGRSGSAIASEVATMKVTEEIDALKTMSLNPIRYIIVPKMHASLFTLPFLTILANIFGILGGMTISYFYLDLSPTIFYNRMVEVLYFKDILTGTIKSLVFAAIIVQTSSYFGLHVTGGAEGVGKYTTAAVVTSIFMVILADSILGLIFY